MGWLDRRDQRVWDRFVRSGGPSRADRLTVDQPILAWVVLTAFIGVLYVLIGRLLSGDGDGVTGAGVVGALLYSAMFAGVYVILSRRTLVDAIRRWDAGEHPAPAATEPQDGPDSTEG